MHDCDKPLTSLPRHHEVQQPLSQWYLLTVGISLRSRHLPPGINRCEIGGDEPDLCFYHFLVAIFEVSRESRGVKLFDFRSPVRTHSTDVREVSVFRENHRKGLGIMAVPSADEICQHLFDRVFVLLAI